MRELALFAGAGCGLLGTAAIGLKPVAAVELDQHCRSVLSSRQADGALPVFEVFNDVLEFSGDDFRERIDIVTGGFPCQPFSTASRGHRTARNLWPAMCRIIAECQPTYVFAENVGKRPIEDAANDLTAMGYTTEMLPLSASDLGADHVRQRYWLLAYADDKSKLRRTVNAEVAKCQDVCSGVWSSKPVESRVDDGAASRLDRYKAIGNGQSPAVAAAALWTLANA